MDGIHPHSPAKTSFCFLLLVLLRTSAAEICSAASPLELSENNAVGDVVLVITVLPGVTLRFKPAPANPDNPFVLTGNQLVAARVLDYENAKTHAVEIDCTETATSRELSLVIIVSVKNVNDNPPVFDQNLYNVSVNEMSSVGTSVGRFVAKDLDAQAITYKLTPESSGFILRLPTDPDLLVETPLDYEKVRNVRLVLTAQDTPLADGVSLTATTTIQVTIVDVDNRPPWFQPCSKHEVGGAVICQSAGYTGRVVLNEKETGALPLEPGPLYAIDGDSGINGEVTYSFLAGDAGGLFQIDRNTGNITMLKPADVLGTLRLTVLAAQTTNSYQFATAAVTVSVQVKSLHRPQFQRLRYDAAVTAVGVMATDPKAEGEPLRILATDDDYAATAGINPHIAYSVKGSGDFSVVGGYLFMMTDLPEGALSLQLLAVDDTNGETAEAQLSVEVTAGLTTTSLTPTSAASVATTSGGESSTGSQTTAGESTTSPATPTSLSPTSLSTTSLSPTSLSTTSLSPTSADTTSESIVSTTDPSMTSEGSTSTVNSSVTSEGSASTVNPSSTSEGSASTAHLAAGFGPADMAALGATLGVLLLAGLAVIVALALRIRRGDADRRKIFEASVFQSSLVQGGRKGAVQYTNEAFQNDDDDGDSTGSGGPAAGSVRAGGAAGDFPANMAAAAAMPLRVLPRDAAADDDDDDAAASQAGSDGEEKEVRPILTKERRADDGYKSVWFKEDIDPDAREEVVIIPDSREDDSEEEDEEPASSSGREEDDEEDDDGGGPRVKTKRVVFNDADLDSGLGVKMEDDPDEDVLTVDL